MSADEDEIKPPPPAGAPLWMATFADMMSLLLCFFILLLTFAEMDVKKFKQLAGSMRMAFGVQSTLEFEDIPKGTNIFTSDFSAGEQDPLNQPVVTQIFNIEVPELDEVEKEMEREKEKQHRIEIERMKAETRETFEKVREQLAEEIRAGKAEVDTDGLNVFIRIPEQASFPSGSASLQRKFVPTLMKVTRLISETDGPITFAGHTDDVPIQTDRYRSNWDLSSARAVSLAHAVMKIGKLDNQRVTVRGHAETQPLVKNTTEANRARNRRVEVVIGAKGSAKPTESRAD